MADRVGQQLGNYQLIKMLGEGGFAEVYLGEHIHLGTQSAIKVLHTQLTDHDADNFRTEARTVARLVHPHIVRVFDFGVEGKTPFLVMDYAPHGTLRQRHARGTPLPLSSVVSYAKQVADALQYAHEEKLVHRDIKPENMLVGRRNEILLSDFGIAIVAQSSRYQNTQDMAGTIAYMAPEQIQAHPRPASDQYSLGIVVYEWLTGERPFNGSFTEIAAKHSVASPPPLREKVPTLPSDVEQVVMTALAKEPKQRFLTVQAFANALEQTSQPLQSSAFAPTIIRPSAPNVPQAQPVVLPTIVARPMTSDLQSPDLPPPDVTVPSGPLTKPPLVTAPLAPTERVVSSQPTGTLLYIYRGHSATVNALAWSPDSKFIASASDDTQVQVWNVATGRKILYPHIHYTPVRAIAWSSDGRYIASGSHDGIVDVWDTKDGKTVGTYRGHAGSLFGVRALTWAPNGQQIVSGGGDQTAQVWNAITGDTIVTYRGHSKMVTALVWAPHGQFVISGSKDTTVQVWNPSTGNRIGTYQGHSDTVHAVICSPDSSHMASAGDDKMVEVLNTTTRKHVFTYNSHSDSVLALAWSPNGAYIASGGGKRDRTVRIWNAANGRYVFTYRGHAAQVNALAWSPDGKYIASASDDRTVHVWVAP